MNTYKNILTLAVLGAASWAGTMQLDAASYTFLGGGSITVGANWENDSDNSTGTVPGSGDTGVIAVDGTYAANIWNTSGANILQTGGDIVSSGGGTSQNFNFNGGSTYTMTGGSFTSRGLLANGTTINLLGGTWTVGNGTSGSGFGVGNGGTLNIGGTMIIDNNRTTAHGFSSSSGTIDFAADWTGSWTNPTVDTAAWKTEITTGNYTLGGVDITEISFDEDFVVTGNTLSLVAVPEPSSAALLGLGGLALIMRRRK
ncbi:PEP-CTERM sorting domain-containing protein [Verrucomicrobiaceae bacterium 5K15]|uniref:PEP-CTERM sorting domain-containing protein n=1 Tax=Oceaniferula flava TaxID=2800421 RepID=A0AAE2SE97_9BACT|nr:PEP-CTERM sorting domain-containing protein [Oceaniferula flavus]MBK1855309.1 PEP-CTERM sorting domain-containing protein [Oceaniferula flavus]MBM1136615.1 PEP-CTERM sorting domain-containing protein [Oceaniferula flavus]